MAWYDPRSWFGSKKEEPQSSPIPQTTVSAPASPPGLSSEPSSVDDGGVNMGGRRRRHRKTKKAGRRSKTRRSHKTGRRH